MVKELKMVFDNLVNSQYSGSVEHGAVPPPFLPSNEKSNRQFFVSVKNPENMLAPVQL